MVEAVNELCGVQISHYAEVSFDGMQALIDPVGGIDINATDDVDDPEHLDIKDYRLASSIWTVPPPLPMPAAATPMPMVITRACATSVRCLAPLPTRFSETSMPRRFFGLVNSLSDMLVTDMSVQDIVATVNAMRGMDVDGYRPRRTCPRTPTTAP